MVSHDKLFALLDDAVRVTFSRPYDRAQPRLTVYAVKDCKFPFQAQRQTQDKVFHTAVWDLRSFVAQQLPLWREVHIFGAFEHSVLLSKGNVVSIKRLGPTTQQARTHNRTKHYIIAEGEDVPILRHLGIFTHEGKVAADKQDKFRQINRFMEQLADVLADYHEGDSIEVVDYGCGKSYLSFGVYYYLAVKRGLAVHLVGVDRKADVLADCRALAQRYGYSGMQFVADDIRHYTAPHLDLVISLHACDVATDYVLYNAVTQGAKHIFAAPCCQHEWNKQVDRDWMPILNHYGLLRERLSALSTDAVRCLVLEMCGYKVDVVEFADWEDTPKNLLIRATRACDPRPDPAKIAQLQGLLHDAGVMPTLVSLLAAHPDFASIVGA